MACRVSSAGHCCINRQVFMFRPDMAFGVEQAGVRTLFFCKGIVIWFDQSEHLRFFQSLCHHIE